jgi:hypothetical protein
MRQGKKRTPSGENSVTRYIRGLARKGNRCFVQGTSRVALRWQFPGLVGVLLLILQVQLSS